MNKMLACFVFLFLLFSATSVLAVPDKRFDTATQSCRILTFFNSGWVSEGNDIFQNTCKTCHHLGNDKGAPFIHTESMTMKGWNRVFAQRYPACARNGAWASLSQDQLLKLNDYLYRNAWGTYDANTAESCG